MQSEVSRRSVLAGMAAVTAAGVAGTGREAAAATGESLALTRVTVIDATGAPAQRDMTVLVRHGRITAVGPVRRVPVPPGATVVDGTGKFLIPGLADMHVHSSRLERTFPPLYLVNGVTTVREMGYDAVVDGWRREVEAGTRLGPRWTIGSLIVDGFPSLWQNIGVPYLEVADAAGARNAVRAQQAAGADFIKTYTRLSRESFRAIAAESRRRGIPFLGHVPDFVRLTEASDLGLLSVEHLYQSFYATSSREDELRAAVAKVPIAGGEYGGWYTKMHALEYAAARSHDRRRAARVFEHLARNRTRLTPTLVVHRLSDMPQDVRLDDRRLDYIPADLKQTWEWSRREIYMKDLTPKIVAEKRELFDRRLGLVAEIAAADVPLLAGSDVGASYLLPGFSLHDELDLLVQAGVSPMRALQAATREPAAVLGRRDQGTIERGKVADLVLLDADPLRDIRNTTRINSVVVRGRLIDSAERDRMLKDVLLAAGRPVPPGAVVAGCPC